MDLQHDFTFAENDPDICPAGCGFGSGKAAILRYVASINAGVTKKEFVAEAVKAGYNASTADIQFTKSRRSWVADFSDCQLLPDGRLVDKT